MTINVEALKQLVRVLNDIQSDTRKVQSFSLVGWLGNDYISRPYDERRALDLRAEFDQADVHEASLTLVPHECGTTACACGYAGLDRWFRDAGFQTSHNGWVEFKEHFGWDAVKKFFRLNQADASYLFDAKSYIDDFDEDNKNHLFGISPQDVVDRLEATIRRVEAAVEV